MKNSKNKISKLYVEKSFKENSLIFLVESAASIFTKRIKKANKKLYLLLSYITYICVFLSLKTTSSLMIFYYIWHVRFSAAHILLNYAYAFFQYISSIHNCVFRLFNKMAPMQRLNTFAIDPISDLVSRIKNNVFYIDYPIYSLLSVLSIQFF